MIRGNWLKIAGLVAVFALILSAGARAGSEPGDRALQLKAAFLLNFLKFAEWPSDAEQNKDGEFVLAVVGNDPIASMIKETLEGKSVNNLRVSVETYPDAESWPGALQRCHALFMTRAAGSAWTGLQAAISNRAVLTIADSPGFCAAGGMLNLFEQADRIRFEANPAAAGEAGLQLRSELLKLATIVKTEAKLR